MTRRGPYSRVKAFIDAGKRRKGLKLYKQNQKQGSDKQRFNGKHRPVGEKVGDCSVRMVRFKPVDSPVQPVDCDRPGTFKTGRILSR